MKMQDEQSTFWQMQRHLVNYCIRSEIQRTFPSMGPVDAKTCAGYLTGPKPSAPLPNLEDIDMMKMGMIVGICLERHGI